MIEENKWNEYEEENKNNLLILNLFFIFLHFFFLSTFPLFFLFLTFSSNFLGIKHNIFYKVKSTMDQRTGIHVKKVNYVQTNL